MKKEKDMSDKSKDKTLQAQGLPVTVHAQYVRDISFENPNAPEALRLGQKPPAMDVNIGMDARALDDKDIKNLFEVILSVRAEAKRGDQTVFLAEIIYGITVEIGDSVPENNHHPLLLIEIPKLAFPFVRKLLSDLTTEGGFPPLLLNPVDFHALYMQRFAKDLKGDES